MSSQLFSLDDLSRCFEGSIPAALSTCSADGTPNVSYLSRARRVDDERIALSNQFMSKTARNLAENPHASLLLMDVISHDEFRLQLVYERTERRGRVFDQLRDDVDVLAALTGMQGVFRLRTADVFRVVQIEQVPPHPDFADARADRRRRRRWPAVPWPHCRHDWRAAPISTRWSRRWSMASTRHSGTITCRSCCSTRPASACTPSPAVATRTRELARRSRSAREWWGWRRRSAPRCASAACVSRRSTPARCAARSRSTVRRPSARSRRRACPTPTAGW